MAEGNRPIARRIFAEANCLAIQKRHGEKNNSNTATKTCSKPPALIGCDEYSGVERSSAEKAEGCPPVFSKYTSPPGVGRKKIAGEDLARITKMPKRTQTSKRTTEALPNESNEPETIIAFCKLAANIGKNTINTTGWLTKSNDNSRAHVKEEDNLQISTVRWCAEPTEPTNSVMLHCKAKSNLPHFSTWANNRDKSIKATDTQAKKALRDWCIQHAITSENEYKHFADSNSVVLMEHPNFNDFLSIAVRVSHQHFFLLQANRWKWICDLGAGLVPDYLPAFEFSKAARRCVNRAGIWKRILQTHAIDEGKFCSAVKEWLQMRHAKKNAFILHGPVSTGKTMFANALRGLLLYKTLSNSASSSSFAFGNCLHTRLLVYEEPFLHPTLLEDMKNIFGGATLTVDAKYQQQQPLFRTPILITSNTLSLSHGHASPSAEAALCARSYIFEFSNDISSVLGEEYFLPIDLATYLYQFEEHAN